MRTITVDGYTAEVPYSTIPHAVRISRLPANCANTHEVLIWPVTEPNHESAVGGAVTVALVILTGKSDYEVKVGEGIAVSDASDADVLSALKLKKKTEIAAARYEYEVSGVVVDGSTIETDRESQALITGAALAAYSDETYTLRWKTGAGDFIVLTSGQVAAIAQAVRTHVQGAFDHEATLISAVNEAESEEVVNPITWTDPE